MTRQQVGINNKVHDKLRLIKFYSNIDMSNMATALLEEALESPLLEKVLMRFLLDKKRVIHVITHLSE